MDATDPFLENNGNPQSLNSQEGKFTLPPLRRSLLALGVEGLVESRVDKYEASIDTPFNTPTPSGSSWSTMGPLRSDLSMRGKSSTKLGKIIEEGEAPSLGMNSPAVVPLNLRPASLSLRPAPLKLGDDKEEAKQPVKTDFYGGDDKAEGSPALSELIDNQSEEDEPMRINFYPGTGVETVVVDAARKAQMFNKKKRSDMGLTGLQGKVGKVGKVGKPGGLNINKLSDPEAQSQTVGLGRGLGIKTTTTAEPLGEQIDNFIEELTRAQASDSVRKSNLHVTKRATSNLKGTPRSTSRKGTTLSSASRVVSHPILPSGSRSSSTHPRAFDDTPSRVGDTGAESLNSRLRALRTPGGLDISTSGSNLSDGPLKDKRHHKAQSALSTGQLASGAKTHTQSEPERTDILFFTQKERLEIEEKVTAKIYNCTDHENCTDCKSIEYAYHESVIMAASIPPQERNKIIANNRCLRNIKNDLETLAENGAIVDADFDAIMRLLPNESSINGASKATAGIPAPTPTASMGNLSLNNQQQPPPAYHQATPPLPSRNNSSIPQGEVHRATALYAYHAAGDCNFDVGDEITVIKIVNDDWWIGRNLRTNSEGAFPKTYVQVITNPTPLGNATYNYGNEKASGYGGGYPGQVHQGYQQQGPPPPGPSNPYNSNAVPPMQIAEQPSESKPGKGEEMGKKFGKKLGNAAIFGAGATLGGKVVNSIF